MKDKAEKTSPEKNSSEEKLNHLIKLIEKLVSRDIAPVAPVAPIAPVLPVAPVLPIVPSNTGDHDLLTKIDGKVDQMGLDIADLKREKINYVSPSEHKTLVDAKDDHEKRIRITETNVTRILTFGSIFLLLVGVAQIVVMIFYH